MDLSRFGLIGQDKKCFWGLIGVLWKKPLGLGKADTVRFLWRNVDIGFPSGVTKSGSEALAQELINESENDLFKI